MPNDKNTIHSAGFDLRLGKSVLKAYQSYNDLKSKAFQNETNRSRKVDVVTEKVDGWDGNNRTEQMLYFC